MFYGANVWLTRSVTSQIISGSVFERFVRKIQLYFCINSSSVLKKLRKMKKISMKSAKKCCQLTISFSQTSNFVQNSFLEVKGEIFFRFFTFFMLIFFNFLNFFTKWRHLCKIQLNFAYKRVENTPTNYSGCHTACKPHISPVEHFIDGLKFSFARFVTFFIDFRKNSTFFLPIQNIAKSAILREKRKKKLIKLEDCRKTCFVRPKFGVEFVFHT